MRNVQNKMSILISRSCWCFSLRILIYEKFPWSNISIKCHKCLEYEPKY